MATATAPSREDFAKLLDETFGGGNLQEGSVIKGKVVGIEKEFAVIDVGLKTEGRVALREFTGPGRQAALKVGDEVEVYLERVENALGEAVLSRDKARREESWGKLEKAFNSSEKVQGVIFNQVKGGFTVDLDGAVAFLPRSQVDIRPVRDVTPLMHNPQPFQILKMDKRRGNIVVSRRTVLEETRAEQRSELVQSLVLANTGPEVRAENLKERIAIWQRRILTRMLSMEQWAIALSERLFPEPGQEAMRVEFRRRWAANDPVAYREAYHALLRWSVANRLEQIWKPTLVIHSEFDYTTLERKQRWATRIPGARTVTIAGGRHAVSMDKAADFNRVVLEFLATAI